jgi:hypothetical protein
MGQGTTLERSHFAELPPSRSVKLT